MRAARRTVLAIENDPDCPAGWYREWLHDEGIAVQTRHTGPPPGDRTARRPRDPVERRHRHGAARTGGLEAYEQVAAARDELRQTWRPMAIAFARVVAGTDGLAEPRPDLGR